MSNVIKAYTVQFNDNFKMTIDTHVKFDKVLEERKKLQYQVVEEKNSSEEALDGFTAGLDALVVEAIDPDDKLKEASGNVIEEAKKEAQNILDQAKKEAEAIKDDAHANALKKGYDEGMQKASLEIQKKKAEYDEKLNQLQSEYEDMVAELEPKMAEIISVLLEKITGILVTDQENVILYLIEKAFKNLDKCKECTIKVSGEDYDFLTERKEILLDAVNKEVSLHIKEDPDLSKNQAIIETEQRIIDCSLDVQLSNLITDLKLLSRVL